MQITENSTPAEISAAVKALPKLPVVFAKSVLHSQSWTPSAEERAAIRARQDLFIALGLPSTVNVKILDVWTQTHIGDIPFSR